MLVTKIQSSTEPFCGPIILLQQITQIYRAVLPELFWIMPEYVGAIALRSRTSMLPKHLPVLKNFYKVGL